MERSRACACTKFGIADTCEETTEPSCVGHQLAPFVVGDAGHASGPFFRMSIRHKSLRQDLVKRRMRSFHLTRIT